MTGQILDISNHALILDNIDDAIIAVDLQGTINFFNPAAQHLTGLSEKRCIGRSFYDRFVQQPTLCHLTRTALEDGRSISDHETVTLASHSRQRKRPVSATVSPIFSSQGQQLGAVIVLHDLIRIKSLEETIRHAERLSMVGTMAAGLAHEIKNPLGGIKGAAQLMQMELGPADRLQEHTRLIVREVDRINRIVEELLHLAHPRSVETQTINLNQLLNEIVTLQKHVTDERNVSIRLQIDPSIPDICGDRDLLIRLFLNLTKNACEATADKTEVLIESRIDPEYHLNRPGSSPTLVVQVNIYDKGSGISEAEMQKIFTPYYTTKVDGSGLGLAICQKIVCDHDGSLQFKNLPAGGTKTQVSLPLKQHHSTKTNS